MIARVPDDRRAIAPSLASRLYILFQDVSVLRAISAKDLLIYIYHRINGSVNSVNAYHRNAHTTFFCRCVLIGIFAGETGAWAEEGALLCPCLRQSIFYGRAFFPASYAVCSSLSNSARLAKSWRRGRGWALLTT